MAHVRFRQVKQCAFCEKPADSREHAWPAWILKHLKTTPLSILGEIEGQPALFDPFQRALKIRCVCIPCNTKWMKKLEDVTQPVIVPLIDGKPTTLNVPQQWLVTRWAVKTAMVFEYVKQSESLFYTPSERRQFWDSTIQPVPTRTYVWLARYTGRYPLFTFAAAAYVVNSDASIVNAYTTTLAFGALAIQVITVRPNSDYRTITTIHPKVGAYPWPELTIRIWPTDKNVFWPPQRLFTDDSPLSLIDDFHGRFHNPKAELGGHLSDDVVRIN